MYTPHEFEIFGLSLDAKPEEVGPAYIARAKKLALVIQDGDVVAVSKAIEELHMLHEAYPKTLEASEMQVQLLANHNILISPHSANEERILAGIRFISGADERHLNMLEAVLLKDSLPEQLREKAAIKLHRLENRSHNACRGNMHTFVMTQYAPALDNSSYSNLSDATVEKMATAPFVRENVRDFAGERMVCRMLMRWDRGEISAAEASVKLQAMAIPASGYSASVREHAPRLARMVASSNRESPEGPRWRPADRIPADPEMQRAAPKIPGQR